MFFVVIVVVFVAQKIEEVARGCQYSGCHLVGSKDGMSIVELR